MNAVLIILIVLVVAIGVIYCLYRIGKKTKEQESLFAQMFLEKNAKKDLNKYKRKSTPKVPSIKK